MTEDSTSRESAEAPDRASRTSEAQLALFIGVGLAIAFAAVLVVLVLLDIIPPFTPFIGFAAAIGATIGAYRRRRER